MKLFIIITAFIASLLGQFFFMQSWQTEAVSINILLAFIVVASMFVSREQMLWMALAAGLFSDLYSNLDFGFYMGFYLLLAVTCKYLLKFGESESSWWRALFLIAIASICQAILVVLPILIQGVTWQLAQSIGFFVIFTVAAGGIWYLILNFLVDASRGLTRFSR